jgi:Ty3 transposon capsid-like protein/Zinc knuckle
MVENIAKETKKKLKTPTPFSGKREDLRKFLQEIKIYLMANEDAYPKDIDKVLFVLSYMSEGDANSWKEEFFDTAEQKAAQVQGAKINLGTYDDLIKLIIKDFSPYDAPKDAIYEMKELKLGNSSIEEHVSKFKMLVTKSKLTKNDAVVEYFRESLPIALQRNIMTLSEPPTDLDGWYDWAVKLQNNFIRMKSAISKTQNRRGSAPFNSNKKPTERGPRRFYFDQSQKDPDAMDIDYMSMEERENLRRKGACFGCKEIGHLARDCPNRKKRFIPSQLQTSNAPQKMKGKELHAHVRALLAQMEDKDKEEFFDDAAKEGF